MLPTTSQGVTDLMVTAMRAAAVVAVLVYAGTVGALSASAAPARGAPRTLARTATVTAGPVRSSRLIDYLGVLWRGARRDGGAVRFRHGARWSRWQPLHAGDVQPLDGEAASELLPARRATAYQVRPPTGARDVRAVAINTTDGPRQPAAALSPRTAADVLGWSGLCYRSRAAWGADESLRLDASGNPRETPQYFPVQRLTVHHTVIDDADPAAAVRAIYRYHTVDLGWADIGYQLLVDAQGCVYEGRWSGTDPIPVYDGLPEPGVAPRAVNGAHVLGFNVGNVGVALLGNFDLAQPAPAALRSLTYALAGLSLVSGLDPQGYGTYVNPVTGVTKDTYVISGHRDWLATECPGELLYPRLPQLRGQVAALVGILGPAG
jgi:hypothetical protein